jgi:FkbM family methyltransferase
MNNIGFINPHYIRQVGFFRWITRYSARQFTKRVLKRDNRMRLPTGSMILLPRDSKSATSVYVSKAHIDWGSEELMAKFTDPERDFLDIGAHIGYYAIYLQPLMRKAYAFEPDPRNLAGLRANAASVSNVEVVSMAVSSSSGMARLNIAGDSSVSTLEESSGESIEVRKISIDDFIAERPEINPGLIKIDTEGHDMDVLRGMKAIVAANQPVILIECSDKDLPELCTAWQYSMFAYTCDRSSMKMTFRQLNSAEDLQKYWTNMVFLAPEHLFKAFLAHCN